MEKEFISTATSYSQKVKTPKGNKYRFFKGRPVLVKDVDDIRWFENNNGFAPVNPPAPEPPKAPVKKTPKRPAATKTEEPEEKEE